MIDRKSLANEISLIYDRLQMENVFQIPSSSVKVKYHARVHNKNKAAKFSFKNNLLLLDIYATNIEEGIKVAAALLSHARLKIAQSFAVRHGSLLYILPILHLLLTSLILMIGVLLSGFLFGIITGIGAALTIPILIIWISTSLINRRLFLKKNLEMTDTFESSQEIEETIIWLGTKLHPPGYWIKRMLFYELYYLPFIFLMIFLNSS